MEWQSHGRSRFQNNAHDTLPLARGGEKRTVVKLLREHCSHLVEGFRCEVVVRYSLNPLPKARQHLEPTYHWPINNFLV